MTAWMVRAERGGILADRFLEDGFVAVGWLEDVDLSTVDSRENLRALLQQAYPSASRGRIGARRGVLSKIRLDMEIGDRVVTYNTETRVYHIGRIASDYRYRPEVLAEQPHFREVTWDGEVPRDRLALASRNSLGSTLTSFQIPDAVWTDMEANMGEAPSQDAPPADELEEAESEFEEVLSNALEQSHEYIKDRILQLSPDEMEEFVAAVLEAMGYKATVSPKGADRGCDIEASPDGLGLEQPRIRVEVKHRPNTRITAPEVRSFLGMLRTGDSGLYVSTGGFTREARYEAERAQNPATLVDLDRLSELVRQHYEKMGMEGRRLVPLVRVYWPSE